jgi:transposase
MAEQAGEQQGQLFEEHATEVERRPRAGRRRLRQPVRDQVEWRPLSLDQLIPEDHVVRAVWTWVCALDLSELYEAIQAVEGGAGRSANDPQILFCLWLYGTIKGVSSAHQLNDLCRDHRVYQWICGGVSMNYHTLSDFRTAHEALLDRELTCSMAALMGVGVVELERVTQDGLKVRVSAGAASFHRRGTVERTLAAAQEHLTAVKSLAEGDPAAGSRRQRAARERAAREKVERLAAALAEFPALEEKYQEKVKEAEQQGKKAPAEPRVSTTDPDARVMQVPGGGYRPAINLQIASDVGSLAVVGVVASQQSNDMGLLPPMMRQVGERGGALPGAALADSGYAKKADIEAVTAMGIVPYIPVQKPKDEGRNPYQPRPGDSPPLGDWRTRMGTPEAKAIYKERAATAECVNAQARNRGLQQLNVRGLAKLQTAATWYMLAQNVSRMIALGWLR